MKYILVAGARPNFMKIAPILAAFRARGHRDVLLVHTGQHYDAKMSDEFFTDLQIPKPDINLGVGSGSHAQQTARIMVEFEAVCVQHQPDWVVVVGDVNSTIACALTAKKLGIRVAHVEAGLRSRDMSMPEEINRLCTDAISDLLFTTDTLANQNLLHEGVPPTKIAFVGNTMIDTLLRHIGHARQLPLAAGMKERGYAVLTLHRPSNVDCVDTLDAIMGAVRHIAGRIPIVFPFHPRTAQKLNGCADHPNLHLVGPLSYLPFLGLVAHSRMVLTDSGGIQEETTVLGIPCITMRPNTERPITCEMGTNTLVGNDPECIRAAAQAALEAPPPTPRFPERWDGRAAERIVETLLFDTQSSDLLSTMPALSKTAVAGGHCLVQYGAAGGAQ
jgi:UDP-N-acetylglucosamine 2-epimerase (non-hydrolysing)